MSQYIAFLRAINVGGHNVKMDTIREIFEQLGYTNVETFIASGNIIFESTDLDTQKMEETSQAALQASLGYDVAVFIRNGQELASMAVYRPFSKSEMDEAIAFNVAFLKNRPSDESISKLMTLKSNIDDFHIHEREIYWICKKKQSESTFSNAMLEKVISGQSTLRGINTIIKITEKYHFS